MGKLCSAVLLRDDGPNDGCDSQNNQKEEGQVDRTKEIPDEIRIVCCFGCGHIALRKEEIPPVARIAGSFMYAGIRPLEPDKG